MKSEFQAYKGSCYSVSTPHVMVGMYLMLKYCSCEIQISLCPVTVPQGTELGAWMRALGLTDDYFSVLGAGGPPSPCPFAAGVGKDRLAQGLAGRWAWPRQPPVFCWILTQTLT